MSDSVSSFASSPAGPSSLPHTQSLSPPLPDALERDDYAAADQARERLNKRGLLSSVSLQLPHLHRSRTKSQDSSIRLSYIQGEAEDSTSETTAALNLVNLVENVSVEDDENYDKDVYRWAVLYENQRGAMVFSTAYYSPLTLLPLDPPPFTIPTATRSPRKNQPTVTLEDYPLPDGSWKWVSRAWMIDMRGDGEVQYDGFEYARSFRSKKWGPDTGFMSNHGLVRRRRWIRLMMRPAQAIHDTESLLEHTGNVSVVPEMEHREEGATRPPSVMFSVSDDSEESGVWRGDEDDWRRCHSALRHLSRDGRKLEVWAHWLGVSEKPVVAPCRSPLLPAVSPFLVPLRRAAESGEWEKQVPSSNPSTEDVASTSSSKRRGDKITLDVGVRLTQAPKEHVATVIRCHASDILDLFVYPESRAKYLALLGRVGLLPELRAGLGASDSVQVLDFWSYTKDFGNMDSSPS
ncbi:hypothetical protein GSI_06661 [Ganoderma sinense ZZ0214-1]|uniref:TECPR1-like DysF domain-containing protein n=1 Tax=Ganoderma sinense ZZ0214-1 TaxID=1077348 RepID=A0A2G8SE01_9APHY|nr:hypothetical protein GSI_06661 [Ganoderma sinense ZZ0214-1]